MAPRKRMSRAPFPGEYLAVARERDKWFAFGIAAIVGAMMIVAAADVFPPALVLVLVPAAAATYAAIRFAKLDVQSGKLLKPWLAANPYLGPASALLNPLRLLVLTHPLQAALLFSALVLGILIYILAVT